LTQKGDLEVYIREFNTLRGLATDAAALNDAVVLRYFIQGLSKDLRIVIAGSAPKDLVAVQADTRRVDQVLRGHQTTGGGDPMDTTEARGEQRFKGDCTWCGYQGHHKRECHQKAAGKPRKDKVTTTAPRRAPGLCYCCNQPGHRVSECKARVILSAEVNVNLNHILVLMGWEGRLKTG
jgi:hypothetical protein